MTTLPKRISENGFEYELRGDYYYPIIELPENKPIG